MKIKLITICILLTLFVQPGKAQTSYGTWQLVDGPGNFTEQLNSMAWPVADTGFFLGNATTNLHITRTFDGGTSLDTIRFPNPIDTIHSGGKTYYNHHSAIQSVTDMAWPNPNTGFVVGLTGTDTFGHTAVPIVLATQDAGTTWSQYYPAGADTLELWNNIYFPNASVGYGSAASADGSENYIVKTTDGGKTWNNVYKNDSLAFKNLHFIDPNNGIFLAQGISLHLGYTTNGGSTFHIINVGTDAPANFLHWNNDTSWLVGADNVYRSKDSGKTWKIVLDTSSGSATVGAFYNDSGFVFRANIDSVYMTTNSGASWTGSRISSPDSITPISASMVSPYLAYLLAFDNTQTGNALFKIEFAVPTGGGGQGVVNENPIQTIPFAASYERNAISFTMAPAPEARSIQILDVLGRTCASLALAPNAVSSQVATSALRTGTYFAQLDGSMVKFMIP